MTSPKTHSICNWYLTIVAIMMSFNNTILMLAVHSHRGGEGESVDKNTLASPWILSCSIGARVSPH